ncbi:T9SS type A sorting domain-containing protein [candidate division KSB1 bacterium]|nr:T9SS type A sorting domain-containing protein [candidate division KSB1 bacterium]
MRKLNKFAALFVAVTFVLLGSGHAFAQGMGGHGWHNGYHGMDWPDTLSTITVSGTVRVDSLPHLGFMHNLDYQQALYFLDSTGDGIADYLLMFGPWWYQPANGAQRPNNGDTVTITGGVMTTFTPSMLVVFTINGVTWREPIGPPAWSGGWMHRNATDSTRIYCPTDSSSWMHIPAGAMGMGMMWPDSIFCQFEWMHPDSLPVNGGGFMGFHTEFTRMGGHGMMNGGMMNFLRSTRMSFHYPQQLIDESKINEASIQLFYLDSNNQWQVVSGAQLDTQSNTVTVTQNPVRSYYALRGTTITSVEEQIALPSDFVLQQNYPNPFNPATTISYELHIASRVNLSIFNVRGEQVATLVNAQQPGGKHVVRWRGIDAEGKSLASGIYWYRLEVAGMTATKKLIMMK